MSVGWSQQARNNKNGIHNNVVDTKNGKKMGINLPDENHNPAEYKQYRQRVVKTCNSLAYCLALRAIGRLITWQQKGRSLSRFWSFGSNTLQVQVARCRRGMAQLRTHRKHPTLFRPESEDLSAALAFHAG
jgi:hypothetical protein